MPTSVQDDELRELAAFIIQSWHGAQGNFARSIEPDIILSAEHTESDTMVIAFELGQSKVPTQAETLDHVSDELATLAAKVRGLVWFYFRAPVDLKFTPTAIEERTVRYEAEFDLRASNLTAPDYR